MRCFLNRYRSYEGFNFIILGGIDPMKDLVKDLVFLLILISGVLFYHYTIKGPVKDVPNDSVGDIIVEIVTFLSCMLVFVIIGGVVVSFIPS